MGLFSVDVELEGPAGREVVSMLVDSGATYSTVSSALVARLGLPQNREDVFEFADGRRARLPIVEARVRVNGRQAPTLAVVTEGRPLLGAFALEGLGLGIDPTGKRLIPVGGMLGAARLWFRMVTAHDSYKNR
jgi:clan AA aspartic protease